MTRAWTKAEAKKVLEQLLVQGCGRSKKVWRKAGLSDTHTLEEVQELEQALKTLIYRAGGIHKSQELAQRRGHTDGFQGRRGHSI
ncbi:hypothetical protein WJX77_010304 [Trebouxia sp. C0004]